MNKLIFEFQRFDGTLISGTDDDDEISNTLDSATINASDGDDYIYNDGSNVSIEGATATMTFATKPRKLPLNITWATARIPFTVSTIPRP